MRIIFFTFILALAPLAAMSAQKENKVVCHFADREVRIDLGQKLNLNEDFGIKAEFFLKNTSFGYCMLKIVESFSAENTASGFSLINFSKQDCKYISEKQSADLKLGSDGFIKYNQKEAFVDLFKNKQPMKCKVVK